MRTVDEKYSYNKRRNAPFSAGYCAGVTLYRNYGQMSEEERQAAREYIDSTKRFAQQGDQLAKGVMCGIRDAANERKSGSSRIRSSPKSSPQG